VVIARVTIEDGGLELDRQHRSPFHGRQRHRRHLDPIDDETARLLVHLEPVAGLKHLAQQGPAFGMTHDRRLADLAQGLDG
jgi:hypothetical protein